jgi:2'-5' RNA ligase
VAVTPPDDILQALARAAQAAQGVPDASRLRWAQPESWHVTLAFFGEVDEAEVPELTERLERAARRHAAMTLSLTGGGRFGDRTLWAGVSGETGALAQLAASVAAGARRTGIEIEERAFRGHLTLARSRPHHRTNLRPFVELLAQFTSRSWTADRIELIRSHPPVPGAAGAQPHYETIGSWPLGHRHGCQLPSMRGSEDPYPSDDRCLGTDAHRGGRGGHDPLITAADTLPTAYDTYDLVGESSLKGDR